MLKHIKLQNKIFSQKECVTRHSHGLVLLAQQYAYSFSRSHPNSTREKIQLPALKFDKTSSNWTTQNYDPEHTRLNGMSNLTFLTYNVWFEPHNFNERGVELRKIMQNSNADFICLQEVTRPFYEELMTCSWIQDYYVSGNPVRGYKTLLLSRHPCRFFIRDFPSNMRRSILYSEFELNDTLTAVGTVHLESLDYPDYRKLQLNISYEELEPYKTAFLMGDFNFDSEKENKNIRSDYTDIWKELHPSDPGYTMLATRIYTAWRPDRVIMKKNDLCKAVSIEKIGTEPIEKYKDSSLEVKVDEVKTPSDHYGLKCFVEIKK